MTLAMRLATPIATVANGLVARRTCACGGTCSACRARHHAPPRRELARRAAGGRDFSRVPATSSTTIRIGPADDPFEREARRVADAVVSGGSVRPQRSGAAAAQREMDGETSPIADDAIGERDEGLDESEFGEFEHPDADEDETELDNPTGQPMFADGAFSSGGRAALPLGASRGSTMEPGVRAAMERGIGHDFAGVRIHTDAAAAQAAESIQARAFTVGSDVYFASRSYDPGSARGRHLLAHELTHVVQQSGRAERGVVQRQRRRRRPAPPPSKSPAKRKRAPKATFCTVHKRQGKKPCGPSTCDGNCSGPTNAFTHNPCCGNEKCEPAPSVDPKFFIRHLDVNRSSQMTTAEWGTRSKTLSVATFLTSPNASATPTGTHTIGRKCGPCHTNGDGDGMAWLAGFVEIQYGFHDSQRVAKGTKSHGCVRVAGCGCAKEIHDNTDSGTTTVCVHDGKHCDRPQPQAGAADSAHSSVCGTLHVALPPAPKATPKPAPKAAPKKGKAGAAGHATPPVEDDETELVS